MKRIDEDKYMEILDSTLKKAEKRNIDKIIEVVQRDYSKEIISRDVYRVARRKIDNYSKNMPLKARIKITKTNVEDLGVKIEGHRINKIIERENEEER